MALCDIIEIKGENSYGLRGGENMWEVIEDNLSRLKVPGGWLVKVSNPVPLVMANDEIQVNYGFYNESITFVPDPGNTWIL